MCARDQRLCAIAENTTFQNEINLFRKKRLRWLSDILLCLLVLLGANGVLAEPDVLFAFGTDYYNPGSGPGEFDHPADVAVDSQGRIYVADTRNHRIQIFDADGNYLSEISNPGLRDVDSTYFVQSVALDASDTPYWNTAGGIVIDNRLGRRIVSSYGAHIVTVIDHATDTVLFRIGTLNQAGSADGQFNGPFHVDVDSQSNIYVAEQINHRVQVFDPDGNFLYKFITRGVGDAQANSLPGVAIDADDNIIVVADNPSNLQAFDSSANFLFRYGSLGCTHDVNVLLGKFCHPLGVESDGKGNILVADTDNNRVQVLKGNLVFSSLPVADAGADQQVNTGDTVILDGSGSADPEGDALTYLWTWVSQPPGSLASLSDASAVQPNFKADVDGEYVIELVVSDGIDVSEPDTVVISATTLNLPPIANAGPDQNTVITVLLVLDGRGSSDPNGDPLTYSWTLVSRPEGSSATLDQPESATPTLFTDIVGDYLIQLVVNDGEYNSTADFVTITAVNPVTADAGPDQTVLLGENVQLDASGSLNPNGLPVRYSWQIVSKPADSSAELSDPAAENPTFAVDATGEYVIRLFIWFTLDGIEYGSVDNVTIRTNSPPIALIGSDYIVTNVGLGTTLSGLASSDPDDDPLSYSWTIVSTPRNSSSATLLDPTAATTGFTSDVWGEYSVQLVVNDSFQDSEPDLVTIKVRSAGTPFADAGADQTVFIKEPIQLDGSGSYDPDGDYLSYDWSAVTGFGRGHEEYEAILLSEKNIVNPTYIINKAPSYPQDYVFQLCIYDNTGHRECDEVVIHVINEAPNANAGLDQYTNPNRETYFNAWEYTTDRENDRLEFSWSVISKPDNATVDLTTSYSQATFKADLLGEYKLSLEVTDEAGNTATDTVIITVVDLQPPVADAGADHVATLGDTVTLDGSQSKKGSIDEPLTYSWRQIQGPFLYDKTTDKPHLEASYYGVSLYGLRVSDGYFISDEDTVSVSVPDDDDNDGIYNSVDPEPLTYSNFYDDGQGTFGEIVDRGNGTVHVFPYGGDINILASEPGAIFKPCGSALVYSLKPESFQRASCGSVSIVIDHGAAQVELFGANGTVGYVTLSEGDNIKFDNEAFYIQNNGSTDVTVEIDGQSIVIEAGAIYELAPGPFTLLAAKIDQMVELGILSEEHANGLIAKANIISAQAARQNVNSACNLANAFINQTQALVNAGILSEQQSQDLLTQVEADMQLLGCSPSLSN